MSERYYWLKLKRDFFKRHDIRIVEEMPNGKEYILFYLKLLCESVDHEGNLRFSDQIPYNEEMLAVITNTNVDIVRSAVKIFAELRMMDILDDGTIYMNEVQGMIGSVANNDNANRQRRFREAHNTPALPEKTDENNSDVTEPLQERYASVTKNNESKSKSKNKSESKNDTRVDYDDIIALYHETCVSYPKIRTLSDKRKQAIKARLKKYSVEDFKEMFAKAEASDFLKGANNRNWSATFDWMMNDANFAKILDGNYDNKQKQGNVVIPMPDYMNKQKEEDSEFDWLKKYD